MSLTLTTDEQWMLRCFDLARKGIGAVSPNPPVGAVLVYQGKILAEGYHHYFGGAHAEVEAIHAVPESQRHLIRESILYVSLEPCCITGKTPPCSTLILQEGIRDVRISAMDPNPKVAGKGIAILQRQGVVVQQGILAEEGEWLIRNFRTNILLHRPYITLKWAQSKFGISGIPGKQTWFSHEYTRTFSHQLRAECDCILVGARSIETDDPQLTTRDYIGKSPHRSVYDPSARLNSVHKVFADDGLKTFYFSNHKNENLPGHVLQFFLNEEEHASQMINELFRHNIGNLLVEGGAFVHQLFIKENLWDEAWVIQTPHEAMEGIRAPNVRGKLIRKFTIGPDTIVGMENETR